MSLIKVFLVMFLFHSALSSDDFIRPCKKDDTACLTESAQNFLEKTSAGVPAYNIIAIDPFHKDHIQHTFDSGEEVQISNVTVAGLKRLVVVDLKIDTKTKDVVLLMENLPEIVADIEVNGKTSKLSAKGKIQMIADYKYSLVPDTKGVHYFTVEAETLRCTPQGVPEVSVLSGPGEELWKDKPNAEEIKKKLICVVSDAAFHIVLHNLRESSKIYPATSYFTDLSLLL